jgi:hypothetical protein
MDNYNLKVAELEKKLIEENQRDLQNNHNEEDTITLIKTHQYLKNTERELTKLLGTVIFR